MLRREIMLKRKQICDETGTNAASSSDLHDHTSDVPEISKCRRVCTLVTGAQAESSFSGTGSSSKTSTADHNLPSHRCKNCGAYFWFEERVKSLGNRVPIFSLCCRQGRVPLPNLRDPPIYLRELLDYSGERRSKHFREYIRLYNSLFAFTSIGGKIDREINKGQGPYVFKLNGQNHHLIGSLLPMDGDRPHFAQLYIYDTENEISNRIAAACGNDANDKVDEAIVSNLIDMFNSVNELVKAFRMARDRFTAGEIRQVSLTLPARRDGDGLQYNGPSAPEMAALVVGDIGDTDYGRDIVVEHRTRGLRRINDLHPTFMAMQYPLLFPYGEDGYKLNILYKTCTEAPVLKRGHVTRREYYSYMLQQREHSGWLLIRGGRLYQQYIVDAFTSIEDERLRYIRYKHQQEHYRSEIYRGVQDAFLRGDVAGRSIGQRVILPSSFTGSPRYMIQNYHDAMAICRSRGNPDLFITFTCNVQWNEIRSALSIIPGQKVEDRPDIVSRVFHMKLNQFIDDIKKQKYFGNVTGAVYTVEFQKRGLPHVHIIVWLHENDKYPTPTDIDNIISAEIPDQISDPLLYSIVSKFMVHGPCGNANRKAPCMKNGKCTKHFPKKYYSETAIGEDGFAVYRRRDDQRSIIKAGVELDNRFIVPYNRGLLLKYEAHINVEWCNRSRAIKYLFKYVNKGPDRTRALLQEIPTRTESTSNSEAPVIDEVKMYEDCRYVSPYESTWRIFEFHIHFKFPNVETLSIHLPLMNNIVFRGDLDVNEVLNRLGIEKTMLTEWIFMNNTSPEACQLMYTEFPSFWRWDGPNKTWLRRQRGDCIGRISFVHPSVGEVYYLRILLSHVKGPKNFVDVRTVNGIVHETFKQACDAMGLIGNDKEWHEAMDEASVWATAAQLRSLFVTLVLFCEVVDATNLFEANLESMQEDVLYRLRSMLRIPTLQLSEEEIRNKVLTDIENILKRNGSSLSEHRLPEPTSRHDHNVGNTILMEELAHNTPDLHDQNIGFTNQMNDAQEKIYEAVLEAVYSGSGGLFFLYGHGGTGKTFVYKAIITRLRSEGKIVIAVASSGIASLLLPGGRTAHSRFKIPIEIHDESTCHIKKGTHLAELLTNASLIVWDEAPMAQWLIVIALRRWIEHSRIYSAQRRKIHVICPLEENLFF